MNESKSIGWQQALGFFGVIVSLLFVAYELKQSRDIATADMYLASAELEFEATNLMLSPDIVRPVIEKYHAQKELLPSELAILHEFADAWITISDTIHFQYQLGLVTEEVWAAERAQVRDLLGIKCFSERFKRWGDRNRASFADDLADLLAAAPKHEDCFPETPAMR